MQKRTICSFVKMVKEVKVGFVGAGAINFGGAEGPWDHASRLEKIEGVKIVGIADPQTQVAEKVLAKRRQGANPAIYTDCQVFAGLDDLVKDAKPDIILVGTPPNVRGSHGRPMELNLVKAGINVFVEKPLSVASNEEFAKYVKDVVAAQQEKKVIVSVGYMFRYHAAILKMKEILKSYGRPVMAVNLRYFTAYEFMDHAYWWDVSRSGGPIVEQATHFVDLARHLGGEIMLPSIQTICTRPEHSAGNLSVLVKGMEDGVQDQNRVPRVTMSTWRFQDGGCGSLTHTVALHAKKYDTAIDVICDGLRMTLEDIYSPECHLIVRRGSTDNATEVKLSSEDMYLTELQLFVDATRSGDTSKITSTYEDAAKTYLATLTIRGAERK